MFPHLRKITKLLIKSQAVSKILIGPTISDLGTFRPGRDQQRSQNHFDRSIEDVVKTFLR